MRDHPERRIDLLVRAAHLDPPRGQHARSREIAPREVTAGRGEDRARVLAAACLIDQRQTVAGRSLSSAANLDVVGAVDPHTGVGVVRIVVFPGAAVPAVPAVPAVVAHAQPITEKLRAPESVAIVVGAAQPVDAGAESGEVGCSHEHVAGLQHPDVIAAVLGQRQRLGSMTADVGPRSFVQFA